MFERPPSEKQWLSWLYVVFWILFIFVTIPLARTIQKYVAQQWSRDLFTVVVASITAVAFVAALIYVRRFRKAYRSNYFWLTAIAGIFFGYTIELGKQSPEEAIHFVQYGVLGILVYRALAHRLKDTSIYFAAAVICGVVGSIDEFIQWLTPRRLWGLRDIWLNFFSSALVQIAIAKGLQPTFVIRRFSRANLRLFIRLTIAAVSIFGASLLITPARIDWLAERIDWLEFLRQNDSVLLEYGYLYDDPEIGVFRSRFTPEKLKQIDQRRAAEAAEILNWIIGQNSLKKIVRLYSPINDPFVHELGVHLFRRDRYFETALEYADNPVEYAERLTIALRENQILEKYFSNTLQQSNYAWTDEKLALARRHLLHDEFFDSWVSRDLITRVSERQVVCFFIILLLGLIFFHWYLAKKPESGSSSER